MNDPEVRHRAWLIPSLVDCTNALHGEQAFLDELHGTVAWRADVFCDTAHKPVVDKYGVKHYPQKLYTHPLVKS